MAKMVKMTEAEIVAAGGVFVREDTYFNDHYDGWVTDYIYLLDGEEVYSHIDWVFHGR